MSEMCYTLLAENTGCKKSPFWHHCTTLSGCILAAVSGQKCHCENLRFKRSAVTQDHQKRRYSVEFCA